MDTGQHVEHELPINLYAMLPAPLLEGPGEIIAMGRLEVSTILIDRAICRRLDDLFKR